MKLYSYDAEFVTSKKKVALELAEKLGVHEIFVWDSETGKMVGRLSRTDDSSKFVFQAVN